jgi:ribonuclease P protein component
MLSRRLRLSRSHFASSGPFRKAESEHFSVSIRPLSRTSAPHGALAAVVSKKVARRSVDRHLLKRRMLAVSKSYVTPGYGIVVYARAGSFTLPFHAVNTELTRLLSSSIRVA